MYLGSDLWNAEDVPGACNLGCHRLGLSVCRKVTDVFVANPAIKPLVGLRSGITVLLLTGGFVIKVGFAVTSWSLVTYFRAMEGWT